MSNTAALRYSDAAYWWMSDTPLKSSHTHSLQQVSSWARSVEEWRQRKKKKKSDVSGALDFCCIRIQVTWTNLASLPLAERFLITFPWLSCSIPALWDCQHATSPPHHHSHCPSSDSVQTISQWFGLPVILYEKFADTADYCTKHILIFCSMFACLYTRTIVLNWFLL